ncbi:MAG: hypothetical protein E6G09_00305 [Actinobacteria bacterium]|nr:MAG: hypothetical protein E6G18_07455 [Actinomycetota bacterium]TML90760.1 MAG: hypothetical protein E6G09_00305 [Actinomycetota bacterium]
MRMTALLGANALMLVAGFGMLPLLGIARSWRLLFFRCGLAYLCGILLVGIVSAHLALVHVSFGWTGLGMLAALSLGLCTWRLKGTERPSWRRPGWIDTAGFAALVALMIDYGRAFRVAPLNRYDAWAIWALKGHALYAFGWADPVVFAGASYRFANLDYPLLIPSLEAVDFRTMGAFDTRLVHVQFLLFLVAALLALFALLRDRVPSLVLWLSLFALALAPAVFDQLLTAYADVPLALVFGVGVGAAGRWVITNERWALALASFCFAGALLTKNEGSLFVLAVFLGLLVTAHTRWRALAVAASADLLLLLPWRIYVHSHQLHDINYSLGDSFDYGHVHSRLGVGPIAFRTLAEQMLDPQQWGLLVAIFAALLAAALVLGLRALPLFALVWTIVAWLGLSWIYVISHLEYSSYLDSTKERIVASIVVGSAALVPLLAAESWTRLSARDRARARSDGG